MLWSHRDDVLDISNAEADDLSSRRLASLFYPGPDISPHVDRKPGTMRQDPGPAELSPDTRPGRTDHRRAGLRGCPADHAGPRYPGPGYAGLRRRADRRYAGTGAGSLVIGRRGGSTGPSCTPAGRSAPAMDARLPGRRRPAGHRASLRAPGGRAGILTPTRPAARWLPGRGARRYPSRLGAPTPVRGDHVPDHGRPLRPVMA